MLPPSLQRYSRYVSLMKVVLPIGILLALGLSVLWPYLRSISQEGLIVLDMSSPEIQENRMIRPHYVSTDKKGQPCHINADWAKQRTDTLADLARPHGLLTTVEGQTFDLKANTGLYDTQGKVLNLEGNVTLISTDGYHVKTEKAQVTLDAKIIDGNTYVEGEGPTGSLRGQNGFRVESLPGGKRLTLKGRSRVVIQKAAFEKQQETHVH